VLPTIGIDRILLETDSPYLAPVPYRGRRNQSAYLPEIAYAVASALSLPIETIAEKTVENTRRLFHL
jgi:TatD DNase family protein